MTTNCVASLIRKLPNIQSDEKTSDWKPLGWDEFKASLIITSICSVNDKQLHFSMMQFCTRQKTLSFLAQDFCFYKWLCPSPIIVIFLHLMIERRRYKYSDFSEVWPGIWLCLCMLLHKLVLVFKKCVIWGCIETCRKFHPDENHHKLMSV